jgi:hypothetical protein
MDKPDTDSEKPQPPLGQLPATHWGERLRAIQLALGRFIRAGVRALLVIFLIATPSVLLPGTSADGRQMVALIGLFLAVLTFIEYNATYPGLIEFRDAPPFNRLRFATLFSIILALTLIAKAESTPNTASLYAKAVGDVIGRATDFPYSPVRLATLMMTQEASSLQREMVRVAAGMSYLIALLGLAIFVVLLKATRWPARHSAFNVWVNLPTFDPTRGGDVVQRLTRDARINILLGFVLPFVFPAVVRVASKGFEPAMLTAPQTLIWVMTAWAFLPASLFMRGIAMGRVAEMIRRERAEAGPATGRP